MEELRGVAVLRTFHVCMPQYWIAPPKENAHVNGLSFKKKEKKKGYHSLILWARCFQAVRMVKQYLPFNRMSHFPEQTVPSCPI